jgi:hypothetical protein
MSGTGRGLRSAAGDCTTLSFDFDTGEERYHREPYHELTPEALDMSDATMRTAVHRLRLRYAELLREEIAATLADPDEVEGEIRFLLAALERA